MVLGRTRPAGGGGVKRVPPGTLAQPSEAAVEGREDSPGHVRPPRASAAVSPNIPLLWRLPQGTANAPATAQAWTLPALTNVQMSLSPRHLTV